MLDKIFVIFASRINHLINHNNAMKVKKHCLAMDLRYLLSKGLSCHMSFHIKIIFEVMEVDP